MLIVVFNTYFEVLLFYFEVLMNSRTGKLRLKVR